MRKLFLLATMALAATALAATPALATSPDFPYDDYDAGSWRGVVGLDYAGNPCSGAGCEIEIGGYWEWHVGSHYATCDTSMSADVSYDGGVEVTEAQLTSGSYCFGAEVLNLPAEGRICHNVDTGEFWLRQSLTVRLGPGPTGTASGELFALLSGDGDSDGIVPDAFTTPGSGPSYQYFATNGITWYDQFNGWITNPAGNWSPLIVVGSHAWEGEEPCGWPELS